MLVTDENATTTKEYILNKAPIPSLKEFLYAKNAMNFGGFLLLHPG